MAKPKKENTKINIDKSVNELISDEFAQLSNMIQIRNYLEVLKIKYGNIIKNHARMNNDIHYNNVPQNLCDKLNKITNIINLLDDELENKLFEHYKSN